MKNELVFKDQKAVGYFDGKTVTPLDIAAAYWSGQIIDSGVVWATKNVSAFFKSHGLAMKDVEPHVGQCAIAVTCGRCQKVMERTVTNRTQAVETLSAVRQGRICCAPCVDKQIAQEKADRERREAQASSDAQRRRESRRAEVALKFGDTFTGEFCPECDTGFAVVRLNTLEMKPFLSCSSFNPHKRTCKWKQSLAPEHHEKYLNVFRQRLGVTKGVA